MHGIAWIAFVLACVAAAIRFRWTWWALPTGIIASMLPFLTVPFDLWMERTGRLSTANRPANHVQTTGLFAIESGTVLRGPVDVGSLVAERM